MKRAIFLALVIFLALIPPGCDKPSGEGFAIYLPAQEIRPADMPVLSHLETADQPIVSIADIISYTEKTHEIVLKPEAMARINGLKIPTSGKVFLVCLNKEIIYWGAFWAPYSSQSFDGVIIMNPSLLTTENTIRIELGYPGSDFFRDSDPRADLRIMESIKAAGKLK